MLDPRSILDNNCSVAADEGEAAAAAIALGRRAVAIDPRNAPAWANLGSCLFKAGRVDEAEEAGAVLVAMSEARPACEGARLLGMVASARGDLAGALRHFDEAMRLGWPGDPERMVDVGYTHLKMGNYKTGWPLYQAACRALCKYPHPDVPRWEGEEDADVLVVLDQGYGDQVMCARFLEETIQRSSGVTLAVKPLEATLFSKLRGADMILEWGGAQYDYQINITGLPEVFGCTPETIPPPVSYIDDSVKFPRIDDGRLKVGICWTGSWNNHHNHLRSVPFEELLALAEDPRVSLFSFQCGKSAADIGRSRAQRLVRDLSGQIEGDWSQCAAALRCMDVVVTPCTALAHVAATLGIPTFVMLSAWADWRWGTDWTTPWYPEVRLFRQDNLHQWRPVVAEVRAQLGDRATEKKRAAA